MDVLNFQSKLTTLTQEQYNRETAFVNDQQCHVETALMSEIEFLNPTTISYSGMQVELTDSAFDNLREILKIPSKFLVRFTEQFTEEGRNIFVERMREVIAMNKETRVKLVLNPRSKEIVRILRDAKMNVHHEEFLTLTNRIIDHFKLTVSDVQISENGEFSINTIYDKVEVSIEKLINESFFPGLTFGFSFDYGAEVMPYITREVCSNGMIGRDMTERFQLKQINESVFNEVFEKVALLRQNNFIPFSYADLVRKAAFTRASLFEMQTIYNLLTKDHGIDEGVVNEYIPWMYTTNEFDKFNLNHPVAKMTSNQKKTAVTGSTVWELVNSMSHIASHRKLTNFAENDLMIKSGRFLVRKYYDLENQINSPFSKN